MVRDVEGSLQAGEDWSLEVVESGSVVFRIGLETQDLRTGHPG
jgi:hypothetical protein